MEVLPAEMWMEVVGKVPDVKDWGRMEKVSRGFLEIVEKAGWTQVRTVEVNNKRDLLCINSDQYFPMKKASDYDKLTFILQKIASKGTNLSSITLKLAIRDPFWPENRRSALLDILNQSISEKITELHLDIDLPYDQPSPVVYSLEEMLYKHAVALVSFSWVELVISEQQMEWMHVLEQPLRAIKQLESLIFEGGAGNELNWILDGNCNLKSLSVVPDLGTDEEELRAGVEMIQSMGARVETLEYMDGRFLDLYIASLKRQHLMGQPHLLSHMHTLKLPYLMETCDMKTFYGAFPALLTLEIHLLELKDLFSFAKDFFTFFKDQKKALVIGGIKKTERDEVLIATAEERMTVTKRMAGAWESLFCFDLYSETDFYFHNANGCSSIRLLFC